MAVDTVMEVAGFRHRSLDILCYHFGSNNKETGNGCVKTLINPQVSLWKLLWHIRHGPGELITALVYGMKWGTYSPVFGLSDCQLRVHEFDCCIGVSNLEIITSLNFGLVHSAEVPVDITNRIRIAVAQWLKRLILNKETTNSNHVYDVCA